MRHRLSLSLFSSFPTPLSALLFSFFDHHWYTHSCQYINEIGSMAYCCQCACKDVDQLTNVGREAPDLRWVCAGH
jgi:hypothetical protein